MKNFNESEKNKKILNTIIPLIKSYLDVWLNNS